MWTHTSRLVLMTALALAAWQGPAQAQLQEMFKKFTSSPPPEVTKQIAVFKINGPLVETPVSIPPLFGSDAPQSLKGLLSRLADARQDDDVMAVVVDLERAALGVGQLEELHAALRLFAGAEKKVYVHADHLTMLPYAVATGAAHISIVPTGEVWLTGVYGETPFLRGTLDKIGVVPDFERCGAYKSAVEPFTRREPSEENQEMMNWLFDGLYDSLLEVIAQGRNVPREKVRTLIDNGPYTAEEALAAGLIDSVKHRQDFAADLKGMYGADVEFVLDYGEDEDRMPEDNFFAMFEFFMKMLRPTEKKHTGPSVGIVYVEGAIQTGEAERGPFGAQEGAFSTSIRKALDEAAADDTVKAVVLRVDSPGGSALASEIILDASRRVAQKKPLIVSMGNVAGSGGYYVTCAAHTVYADRGTITASIGVLGGKLVTTDMWDRLGVNWHPIQRGEMAAMLSSAQTFNDAERAKIRHYMETVYEIFKGHVVAARGDKLKKPIEELAGGRVFTGGQALDLGLVDKIGGLNDAIKFAADQADLADYEIRVIPEPLNFLEMLFGGEEDEEYVWSQQSRTGVFLRHPVVQAALPALKALDPLRFSGVVQALTRLELIHREGVVMMMPFDLIVR